MAYNPNIYSPYGTMQYQQPAWTGTPSSTGGQPVNGLVSVTGIDGAKAYQLPPNSSMPLFDGNADILYVKTTDGAGFPTIKSYRFEAIEERPAENGDYVSREEFRALENRIDQMQANKQRPRKKGGQNGEQPIPPAE